MIARNIKLATNFTMIDLKLMVYGYYFLLCNRRGLHSNGMDMV